MATEPTHDLPSLSSPEVRAQREVMRRCNEDIRRCYDRMFSATRSMLTLEEAAKELGMTSTALSARLHRQPWIMPSVIRKLLDFPQPMRFFTRQDVHRYHTSSLFKEMQIRAPMHDHRDS